MQINNIKILIFLILILMLLFPMLKSIHKENFENVCKFKLTDCEFLDHMIQHHQIAIDMSKLLHKKT